MPTQIKTRKKTLKSTRNRYSLLFAISAGILTAFIGTYLATSSQAVALTYGTTGNGNPSTTGCNRYVSSGSSIQTAINSAASGSTVCVKATNRSTENLTISKPLTLRANGKATVRSITISGKNVTVDGFTVAGNNSDTGILFSGTNHKILNNLVNGRNIVTGIYCSNGNCGSGTRIASNTVTNIQNYGIWISGGDNIVVERNNIYDLWTTATTYDVDAMRVWGTNHKIRNNYFHDINQYKSARYPDGDTPHTDCIQSYVTASYHQLRNALIENNYCVRVSRQCLILANSLDANYGIRDIIFRGNVCETYDSSVINLGSVANITMENNFILGGVRYFVLVTDYAREENPTHAPDKNIRLRNNIVMKGLSSANYFYNNSTATLTDNTQNLYVENPVVKTNADTFHASTTTAYPATTSGDFTKYRSLAQQYNIVNQGAVPNTTGFTTEIDGKTRILGGKIDIGPFEIR